MSSARALVAAQSKQVRKGGAGKHGGNAHDARISRGHHAGRGLSGKGIEQSAKVVGCQPRLVATQNERAWRFRRNVIESPERCVNRRCDPLLPFAVDHRDGLVKAAERDGRADALMMGSEYHDYRSSAGLARQPDGARKECFAALHEQLFGLAEAAAGSCGKYDGGNRHRHQCTGKRWAVGGLKFRIGPLTEHERTCCENEMWCSFRVGD